MRVKDLVQAALLLAVGFILHAVFPPIVLGMKPDFSLTMMFIILILKRDMRLGFLVAIATGIFTAMTTGFPGGQLANVVDKIFTFIAVSALIPLVMDRVNKKMGTGLITGIGTLISGTVFLGTAALVVGLPGSFLILFITIVLPAAIINTITALVFYSVIEYNVNFSDEKGINTKVEINK